ncbi:50S ribosomal protein L31e [Candidatus Woesearchaeota archaeon]|nr:50S ribosomal protein L31e [Candidatus Woesearchaeota archaeon]
MATLERTYTIPLRKEWLKVPKYKRAKKAVIAVKRFLSRHMKARDKVVLIGKELNEELWSKGIKNPPSWIKITAIKAEDGNVKANLVGVKVVEDKKEKPKAEPKKTTAKIQVSEDKKAENIEQQVKEVIKEKTKDKAVKKGEVKIKKELEKLQKESEKKK